MDEGSTTPASCRQERFRRDPKKWKERFRRGCIERLRKSRSRLFEKMRNNSQESEDSDYPSLPGSTTKEIANEIMMEELNILGGESYCPCCSNKQLFEEDAPSSDINEMLQVMEEIREELMREEQMLLQQYNDCLKFNEDCLCAAIECLSTEKVACPVCQRADLQQNKQVIFCGCGLRIDTQFDGITLPFLQEQVEHFVDLHSHQCPCSPSFSQTSLDAVGLDNLVISCTVCDFLEIVL